MLLPKIRLIQADRERILRLLILMPKSVVYDLVHRVYITTNDEEEEEDKTDEEEDDEDYEEKDKENSEAESQEITVL